MEHDAVAFRHGGELVDLVTVAFALFPEDVVQEVEQAESAKAECSLEPEDVIYELAG